MSSNPRCAKGGASSLEDGWLLALVGLRDGSGARENPYCGKDGETGECGGEVSAATSKG